MEIFRALAVLIERPCAELRPVADALGLPALPEETEYSDTLLFQFYPYASIYLDEQGMLGGEARDRIAGFWRAFKLEPPPEPDHLPVMLSLYSQLAEQQPSEGSRDEFWMRARTTFFREHLASWLPFYADRLVTSTSSEFYKQWAGVLLAALGQEGTQLDGRDLVSSHFDTSYALDDPRVSGLEPFLDSLLAPARSGVILTRSHLSRLAKERDLGGRIAER